MRNLYVLLIIVMALVLCSCSNLVYNAKIGNIAGIESALEGGESIETIDIRNETALIVAANYNQVETVEYLCKKGANVNAQSYNGCTALQHITTSAGLQKY